MVSQIVQIKLSNMGMAKYKQVAWDEKNWSSNDIAEQPKLR